MYEIHFDRTFLRLPFLARHVDLKEKLRTALERSQHGGIKHFRKGCHWVLPEVGKDSRAMSIASGTCWMKASVAVLRSSVSLDTITMNSAMAAIRQDTTSSLEKPGL